MVDEEVEIVLREIRDRVVAQARAEKIATTSTASNGSGARAAPPSEIDEAEHSSAAELARLSGYLTTAGRAWDQLPPVSSNRNGFTSRLEKWIKARAKSLSRWFTWEQVNFNAAVHHALCDILAALSQQESAIAELRREGAARQRDLDTVNAALTAQIQDSLKLISTEVERESELRRIDFHNLGTQIRTIQAELHGAFETQRIQIEDHEKSVRAAIEAQQKLTEERDNELRAALATQHNDGQDQLAELHDRQTVLFKQLSLETGETAVFQNNLQRKIEAALAELAQRVKQLEESPRQKK